ncbi:hypothetical protein BU26DRAFT_522857 [Trematosphaeria pertusa]|uniref:Cora-domain-containing protein n=1 Tax=Trematosphaeria pertusa TaxID=390896 RepID=A0A6A6I2Q3_9PLEO|nr:uncharacterized protein BU26DRAFT_522857 [Trematosphaeria pertusa]KAF2244153.1 hypothetical protein BU26DRAFT_522857 [Trematosphaeria pertusa]
MCLNCPSDMRKALQMKLGACDAHTIAKWHEIFLETVRDMYDRSVWSLRDWVRNAERARRDSNYSPNCEFLHEIARHLIHSNETLDVALDTTECVQKYCRRFAVAASTSPKQREQNLEGLERLSVLGKDMKGIKRRSESLRERLQNEINLAFHLIAQRDSRITLQMGEDSRKDSNNMRSIAIVGLVYLPGTFVSGLFGMNFFDFNVDSGRQTWAVSEKLWLYWAITVPLTLATILLWVVAFHGDAITRRLRAR